MSFLRHCYPVLLSLCFLGSAFATNHQPSGHFEKTTGYCIPELGLLRQVEDAGYPFVTLTIEFPERAFTGTFSLNLKTVKGITLSGLQQAIGKFVAIRYKSEEVNALIELLWNGESLIQTTSIAGDEVEIKSISGILSNAAEVTTGDTPGELYIKTEAAITEKFPFFITPEIVQANGKSVVGIYQHRKVNTIMALEIK